MSQTVRVSLQGDDALTDANLDHYSLYADGDNVLIKRVMSGTVNIVFNSGDGAFATINHNLGYIPFYAVYGDILSNNNYYPINNGYDLFSIPISLSAIDGTALRIFLANSGTHTFSYDIFYDDMSQSGTPSIAQSGYGIKVTRAGKDASSTNPNDYIMHSDLNNFKILKQGTSAVTLSGSLTHGGSVAPPYKYFCFFKFPDGKTTITGQESTRSYDNSYEVHSVMGSSAISLDTFGSSVSGTAAYLVYGTGTAMTNSGYVLASSKAGTPPTSTNPEDFNYHSNFNTLKYYNSGSFNMNSISATTYGTVAHNLGYVPFFAGFVRDLKGTSGFFPTVSYAMVPYYLGSSSLVFPHRDVGAFMYADATNIYFKAWFDTSAVGTFNFNFYYKIFKNNLGV